MKCLKIDQDNLHMKFSALNADFSSPTADPLCLRRPAQASIKEGYPSKKWLFFVSSSMKTDRHRHPAYDNKH